MGMCLGPASLDSLSIAAPTVISVIRFAPAAKERKALSCHPTVTGQESGASVEKKGEDVNSNVDAAGNFTPMQAST
jgi:hypothetical protein